ncbi:hypothetical protein P691DRAFT_812767, partial [Macrolepiota fuliginosa MF-IS2]
MRSILALALAAVATTALVIRLPFAPGTSLFVASDGGITERATSPEVPRVCLIVCWPEEKACAPGLGIPFLNGSCWTCCVGPETAPDPELQATPVPP